MASPSIIILLQLLFVLRPSAAAPVNDICKQTKNPSRCTSILISFDTRSYAAALPLLEEIAIDATTGTARQVKKRFHDLYFQATEPKLRRVYGASLKAYSAAVDAIVASKQYLKQRDYAKIVDATGVVGRAVDSSATAVGRFGALKNANDDVGVLGEAVGVIAKNLL